MAKFNTLFDQEFLSKPHGEMITDDQVHSEGILDKIVDWVKGEKVVAYSRFKYMNQFCKSFEDSKVNHGLWAFFMPKGEGYVSKIGMYALGKSASQAMNSLIKSIKMEVFENTGRMNSLGYGHNYDSDSSYGGVNGEAYNPDVKKANQVLSDFETFAKTIERNAATLDPQPQPIELEECKAIVRVLERLERTDPKDWFEPIEDAKEDYKDHDKFFEFKDRLKPLETLARKMEEFRKKWAKFILDEVRFEEVKTRGESAYGESFEFDSRIVVNYIPKSETDVYMEQLDAAIEEFNSQCEIAIDIESAYNRNQDLIDRVKLLQSKDKFDLTTNVVFLEEFNAIKRSYPTLMSSYNVGLEENSDPKIQLNQFVVNLEGIGDKIKRGAQWVWEKIKQLWNKIKEFFSRIFRGKQKEVEEKMNAVNSSDDAAKKAVAAEMKKIDEKSPGEALNVANQSMNESEQALKSIENKVPNIMGAIMNSFEKQIDTLANIQNTKKEIAIAGELAKESTKKLNRSTEELKLAERGIEITPEIEKFLDTPIAKFVAASPDGLGNFTYKFVVTDDGKSIVLEEKFEPKANGKLMQGMSAEEQQQFLYKEADGWIKANGKDGLKNLLKKKWEIAKAGDFAFNKVKEKLDMVISKGERGEFGEKSVQAIKNLQSSVTKPFKRIAGAI